MLTCSGRFSSRVVLGVLRRAGEEADRLRRHDVSYRDGRVVAGLAEVQILRHAEHALDYARRGEFLSARATEEFSNFVAAPAEGERLAHAGLRHAVADYHKVVARLRRESAFAHKLAFDRLLLVVEGDVPPVAYQHTGRVVVLDYIAAAVLAYVQYHERRVGYAAHLADGQGVGYRVDGVLDGRAAAYHRRDYLRCERRKYVRLDAAAEAVGEDEQRALRRVYHLDAVAAELFVLLEQAVIAGVYAEALSRHCRHIRSDP